jgi:hypothetical protein
MRCGKSGASVTMFAPWMAVMQASRCEKAAAAHMTKGPLMQQPTAPMRVAAAAGSVST